MNGHLARRKVWLASFPRSGNTYLRCLLRQCFGLPSTSLYGQRDLGRNPALERYAGHFNTDSPPPELTAEMPLLVKTHGGPIDAAPAIYIVRDGRAATVSLWEFQRQRLPLRALALGGTNFGTWHGHLAAWQPWRRPDTLLLRYEEMVAQPHAALARLSDFLALPIVSHELPSRSEIAGIDGRWVREPSDWRRKLDPGELRLLQAVNGRMLTHLGYQPLDTAATAMPLAGGLPPAGPPACHVIRQTLALPFEAAYWRLRHRLRRWLARRRREFRARAH